MSGEKGSGSTFMWLLPYVAIVCATLGATSWLVGKYLFPDIPLWGHLIAIGFAAGALALTLILLRRADGGDEGDKE